MKVSASSAERERGFALVEILIASLVLCTAIGVYLQIAATSQRLIDTQGNVTDLQQRVRVATDMIYHDLIMAGGGPTEASGAVALQETFAPIIPARTGERNPDPELSHHDDRISLVYVPDTASQTTTTADMSSSDAALPIDGFAPGCPAGGECGFTAGHRVLVFGSGDPSGGYDLFTVAGASAGQVSPARPLSRAYPAGSHVSAVVQRVYYLDRTGGRLMRYDGDESDLPLVDHVVDLRFTYYAEPRPTGVHPPPSGVSNCAYTGEIPPVPVLQDLGGTTPKALTSLQLTDGPACGRAPNRFDGDLLRVRRVRVMLRLEADSALNRGAGSAFVRSGLSPDGFRYIADQVMTFEVSPRNMNLFR